MFTSEFNIECKLKVFKCGYKIDNKKISPIYKNSNFETKSFSKETYTDYMDLINHLPNYEIFCDRLKIFCGKWGLSFKFYQKNPSSQDLRLFIVQLENFYKIKVKLQNGALPKSKFNALPPTVTLSYQFNDGRVLPTFVAEELIDALETAFWLTGELEQAKYKECLHFKTYGMRTGCKRIFPEKGKKKHCSRGCKDVFNQKKATLRKGD